MILESKIPFKYWFSLIQWEIVAVSLFSTGIYLLSKHYLIFNIPISLVGFLGTSIALLLSFKLSQSYDRWWEARKVWGSIVNDSRSLVIQLLNFSDKEAIELVNKMALRQIAWCYSLTYKLRNQNETSFFDKFITLDEFESLKHHKNIPLGILAVQAKDLKCIYEKKHINDFKYIQIDKTLVRLCESMGKLERIKNTVFPKTYRMTSRFFIYLFLIILSLSLSDVDSWLEIPLLVSISIPFFLLEKISRSMQNPFENKPTDTPMLAISRTIETNIKQLINHKDLPNDQDLPNFYLM